MLEEESLEYIDCYGQNRSHLLEIMLRVDSGVDVRCSIGFSDLPTLLEWG
jgi:hypothetical protein